MKRIVRNRRLTPEEAAKYKAIRQQVADELPDLIARTISASGQSTSWKSC